MSLQCYNISAICHFDYRNSRSNEDHPTGFVAPNSASSAITIPPKQVMSDLTQNLAQTFMLFLKQEDQMLPPSFILTDCGTNGLLTTVWRLSMTNSRELLTSCLTTWVLFQF